MPSMQARDTPADLLVHQMMEVMGDEARVDLDLAASIASTASLAPSLQQAKSPLGEYTPRRLSAPASATAPSIALDRTYFALVQKAKDLGTENQALQAKVISLKADCDVYFVVAKEMERDLHEARENGPKQLALKHQEELTALESKAATDADIAAAKITAAEAMIASLKLELTLKLPAHSSDTASRLPTELPAPQPGTLVIEPVTDIGPGYFKKLAQTIKAGRLAASMAFAARKAELLEARLVDMQISSLNLHDDMHYFSDDSVSDGDEVDEDEVWQIPDRLDNMRVQVVSGVNVHDDVNDDSSSGDSFSDDSEDDAAIMYLTEGIEGDAMRERVVRKFNQIFQFFAAAVVVKDQHAGTELAQSSPGVFADVGGQHEMQELDGAVVDVAAVAAISPSYEAGDSECYDATLVQHRLQQTKGRRQHCPHGGKLLHSDF